MSRILLHLQYILFHDKYDMLYTSLEIELQYNTTEERRMKRLAQGKVTLEDNTMDDYSSILCRDNTLSPIPILG